MLVVYVFYCAALMLHWTRECVPLQVSERDGLHGQKLVPAPDPPRTGQHTHTANFLEINYAPSSKETLSDTTVSHHLPDNAPCFESSQGHDEILDDIFAVLREGWGKEGELTNNNLTQFGICTKADGSSGLVLSELANAANRDQTKGLNVLHPTKELLAEPVGGGRLVLTLDLPQSPLLKLNPILLLAFGSPLAATDLGVTFTSQSLHPNTQAACISEGTQYIILTGKASDGSVNQKWRLSVEAKSSDAGQTLQEILIGGESGSNTSMTPLLLFLSDRGTDLRSAQVPGSSLGSSETFSFLCELQKFLGDVLTQDRPESTPVQLDSLQSLPPLTLGLSSSETLLVGLLNSSAPTIFSFPSQGSVLKVHRGELALTPALLEVLRHRLEQAVGQITDVIREEEVGHRAMERLGRLRALSTFPKEEPPAGESQYRAFLLLKALQTVGRAYEVERGLRATRAGQGSPVRGNLCGLHSLTVSLEKYFVAPDTATINYCQGVCDFPLTNVNSHAALLNVQIQSGKVLDRPLCCVPVAYEDLDVVELNDEGTRLCIKADLVAKECGCR
uniref:muellerian-inhibiting factor n=1 Tax=Centroberyx gerrardi TaxID=166262 RepID=UPI003AAEACAC